MLPAGTDLDEQLDDLGPGLGRQVVQVGEDSTHLVRLGSLGSGWNDGEGVLSGFTQLHPLDFFISTSAAHLTLHLSQPTQHILNGFCKPE